LGSHGWLRCEFVSESNKNTSKKERIFHQPDSKKESFPNHPSRGRFREQPLRNTPQMGISTCIILGFINKRCIFSTKTPDFPRQALLSEVSCLYI
jgi:hypothetical protein